MRATVRLALTAALITLLCGCAALSGDPRVRTPGVMFNDGVIEAVVKRRIRAADPGLNDAHLIVVSYNGVVLLAGQVASEALKQRAQEIAMGVERVRKIHNEMEVGGPISYAARTNDTWLTTKVKTKLLANKNTDANKVKVVTENGTVFLMGVLPRDQANAVVDVASTVFGVQRIVKVFEYLD